MAQYNYPVVRTEPFDTIIYGKINDPYFWMSRKANEKELLELTKAQVSLTRNICRQHYRDGNITKAVEETIPPVTMSFGT